MSVPAEPPFPHPLLEALRNSPGAPAFEQGDRVVSRGELLEIIWRLAGAMLDAGLGPGRAVAVNTGVTPEAFAAHIAAYTLGCRVVGVRPGYPAAQLAHVLGMGVDALLVDRSTVTPELLGAAGPITLLSLGPCPQPDGRSVLAAVDLLADTGADEQRPLVAAARPDDVAALSFTSGSTGRPKGCAITYRALGEHWSWQPRVWSPLTNELAGAFERYMLFGTLSSMVVLDFLGLCLLGGGTAVIPEEDGKPLFPYAIERHRITGSIITVPRLYQMLDLLRDEPVDVGCLRALVVAGSPIGPGRLAEAGDRLGPVVYQGYGQTEVGLISVLTPADIAAFPAHALPSVGRPYSGVEISVRDEEDHEVAVGRTGEIYVRTPYLMSGYWGDPKETGETLRDGWVRTRDLGHLDEKGFLHLVGRTRDVIMVNAMVVYAGPIERVLAGHPDVAEAYVAGAPDELTGEAVHAFVVPAEGRTLDCDALAALVGDELGESSVPWTITTLSSVPVAASGKPDKRALLDLLDRRAL
ncbi:AMP-binding protein [Streptosporangium sp. NPDC006930]|uniref:class I adenylate-forming enzyme family protein n=1 Tax=unclassified Streptosporangium TaxID=2632669 RepID=UPI0034186315